MIRRTVRRTVVTRRIQITWTYRCGRCGGTFTVRRGMTHTCHGVTVKFQ